MAPGKNWQHAKYSYGVWEPFAHQASTILRTCFSDPKSRSENNSLKCSDLGTTRSNKWVWDINPLVPGWGTGAEKTRLPECLVLPHTGTWFSSVFWYRADFWSPKSGRWKKKVYTSRFSTGKPNPCNDHIYHFHASESLNLIFLNLKRGKWVIIIYVFI